MDDNRYYNVINTGKDIAVEPSTKHTLEGGSTRSEKAPAYDLVPPYGGRRVARRFGMGAEKHGPGNWMKSINAGPIEAYKFCVEAYNHMMEHARRMANREEPDDDHLGAIGWAVEVLAYAEDRYRCRWTDIGMVAKSGEDIRQSR
jgi:hypothetical protein